MAARPSGIVLEDPAAHVRKVGAPAAATAATVQPSRPVEVRTVVPAAEAVRATAPGAGTAVPASARVADGVAGDRPTGAVAEVRRDGSVPAGTGSAAPVGRSGEARTATATTPGGAVPAAQAVGTAAAAPGAEVRRDAPGTGSATPPGTTSATPPGRVSALPSAASPSTGPVTAAQPGAVSAAQPGPVAAAQPDRADVQRGAEVRTVGFVPEGDAAAAVAGGASAAPAPRPTATGKVAVVKEPVDVPDFGQIAGARIGSLAVPVAGVVRVGRRKNVIGSETTGSIPVHLLFRDEPDATGAIHATGDDGGPDTVAMAATEAPPRGDKAAIPAPAKTGKGAKSPAGPQAKPQATVHPQRPHASKARPAPTADPGLVERPGKVLPGWVGVVGALFSLAGCAAVLWWVGVVPAEVTRLLRLPARPYDGIRISEWAVLALGVVVTLFALGGLGRGRVGYAWVLTLFGDYRGTVRRTGLVWMSPLLLRRRVDVRLRHWRSEPLPAVDAKGTALDVVVLVVWRVRDTVRAALGVDGHEEYLREQVEAAMARVLSQLPADAFHEDAPTLRDAEAVGEALTRMLSADCVPVGVDVFSAQPTRIEYAPEVAAAMQRRRIAAIDAKHRDSVLTSVVDAVDDVVHRLTSRGLVELDDYERKALVKDLTVAFYTGRTSQNEGA
ncbi:SPFH domain-containing protein [Streptomyces sp. NPDC020807]|uniref:SPFH domain-containing protein n=1 Tax=Streptomyces sp. NPDC020807 TaxID=3155119 RepID=UPI0033E06CB1